jgi:hypothetical protein
MATSGSSSLYGSNRIVIGGSCSPWTLPVRLEQPFASH